MMSNNNQSLENELADNIVLKMELFFTQLRTNSVPVPTSTALDALDALGNLNVSNRTHFYLALKATLAKRREEIEIFDKVFNEFWTKQNKDDLTGDSSVSPARDDDKKDESQDASGTFPSHSSIPVESSEDSGLDYPPGREKIAFYSYIHSPFAKGFRDLDRKRLYQIKRNFDCFLNRLDVTRSYRSLSYSSKKGEVELKRTLRKNASSGYEILRLVRRKRKINRSLRNFVILFDVSGSMSNHNEDLLMLILAASAPTRRGRKTSVFCFSTNLVQIRKPHEGEDPSGKFLRELEAIVKDSWGSGTRIGEVLSELSNSYSFLINKSTTLVILSDGLDCGETSLLSREIFEIRNNVRSIVWLNPLADSPTYKPITQGMKAALPNLKRLEGISSIVGKER